MNQNEIDRIAGAISCLRPDWPTASIRTLLADPSLAPRPRRDIAVALTWVACETDSKTPARVKESGPWWKATSAWGADEQAPRPPKPDEACHLCGKHLATCVCGQAVHRPAAADRVPLTDTSKPGVNQFLQAKAQLAKESR